MKSLIKNSLINKLILKYYIIINNIFNIISFILKTTFFITNFGKC